ncbi:MAG: hypothetical protein GWP09_02055 [Nitrospiraceae bacterium]|nr:hypothetical protein [Nitrospiraceae bacterium]
MAQLFDAENNPVEALTPEEVEAKLDETRREVEERKDEEISQIQSEFDETVSSLEQQIKEKEDEMEKFSKKDYNFKKLRDSKEDLEKRLTEERSKVDEKINAIKGTLSDQQTTQKIKEAVGGDEELVKQTKYWLDQFKPVEGEKIEERIQAAVKLATGGKGVLSGQAISSGGGSIPTPQNTEGKISPEAVEVANKMGISNDDLKKHKLI